jgi:hypothetical protein
VGKDAPLEQAPRDGSAAANGRACPPPKSGDLTAPCFLTFPPNTVAALNVPLTNYGEVTMTSALKSGLVVAFAASLTLVLTAQQAFRPIAGAQTTASTLGRAPLVPPGPLKSPLTIIAPSQTDSWLGDALVAVNNGGEMHTFTRVANFGGGVVPFLNGLAGTPNVAPNVRLRRCSSLLAARMQSHSTRLASFGSSVAFIHGCARRSL